MATTFNNKLSFSRVKGGMENVYFIAKVRAFPPLTVRYGRVVNYRDHNYVIDSGGELIIRHKEEVWTDEDLAWARLGCAFDIWMSIY